MFASKIKFLKLISKGGKRGWSGNLLQWETAKEHEAYKESLIQMKKTFSQIWK